ALYVHGVLPGAFAWPAGLGDIAIGVTAPWVALALVRRPGFATSRVFVAYVEAVLGTMRKLGIDTLLACKPSRQRDLVLALIAQRLLAPCSKLASTRQWRSTTLAEELDVAEASLDSVYAALDWLVGRQTDIEKKLAQRHLAEGAVVLYDVSSSFYHGRT